MVESYRQNGKMKQRTIKNFGRLDILELTDKNAWETCKKQVEEYNVNKGTTITKEVYANGIRKDLQEIVLDQSSHGLRLQAPTWHL
jgi:hypothetical protein